MKQLLTTTEIADELGCIDYRVRYILLTRDKKRFPPLASLAGNYGWDRSVLPRVREVLDEIAAAKQVILDARARRKARAEIRAEAKEALAAV